MKMRPDGRPLEADDHARRGRLAGAGLADDGQRAARRDGEGDVVDGDDVSAAAPAAEDLGQPLDADRVLGRPAARCDRRVLVPAPSTDAVRQARSSPA